MNKLTNLILFLFLLNFAVVAGAQQQRSYREKAEFMKHHPCPLTSKLKVRNGCKGYVIDHIDPLVCGGEDKAYNMQWQTIEESKLKDKWVRKNCH